MRLDRRPHVVDRSAPTTATVDGAEQTRSSDRLLDVEGLNISFRTAGGSVQVVQDVSFSIAEGETVGMVGESGSGKTVTGLSLLRLLKSPPAQVQGRIELGGVDLQSLSEKEMRKVRGRDISMIFQEPMTALDPVFTVGTQIVETLRAHRSLTRREARKLSIDALESVGIPLPAQRVDEYPHQLSGGMRQRVMIAMALCCRPRLLIADEPTTAVDVTIQAQILTLLRELNEQHGTAILLITHDLGVVAEACSRVVTLYAGEVVEEGLVDDVLERPLMPYTSGLLRAIPRMETRKEPLQAIPGRVPLPTQLPPGCRFAPRCEHAAPRCEQPQVLVRSGADRAVRCCRHDELHLQGAVR